MSIRSAVPKTFEHKVDGFGRTTRFMQFFSIQAYWFSFESSLSMGHRAAQHLLDNYVFMLTQFIDGEHEQHGHGNSLRTNL